MLEYAEVTVLVDGAQDDYQLFASDNDVTDFVEQVRQGSEDQGYRTEIFILWHEHSEQDDCQCSQYVTDHHPQYVFGSSLY